MTEFAAYRILYNIYTGSTNDINALLADIVDSELRQEAEVDHALEVYWAYHLGNYHRFFKLYQVSKVFFSQD